MLFIIGIVLSAVTFLILSLLHFSVELQCKSRCDNYQDVQAAILVEAVLAGIFAAIVVRLASNLPIASYEPMFLISLLTGFLVFFIYWKSCHKNFPRVASFPYPMDWLIGKTGQTVWPISPLNGFGVVIVDYGKRQYYLKADTDQHYIPRNVIVKVTRVKHGMIVV